MYNYVYGCVGCVGCVGGVCVCVFVCVWGGVCVCVGGVGGGGECVCVCFMHELRFIVVDSIRLYLNLLYSYFISALSLSYLICFKLGLHYNQLIYLYTVHHLTIILQIVIIHIKLLFQ